MIGPWTRTRHVALFSLCWWMVAASTAGQPAGSIYELYISEFMASNQTSLADGEGRFSDWLEIYNATGANVDLDGWHLTDSPKNLKKWTFPAGVGIPSRGRLIVFASGRATGDEPYVDAGGYLHTNFRIDKDGGYLALVAPDGQTVVHAYQDYPAQEEDVSYGIRQQTTSLVPVSAEAAFKVPTAADQDTPWANPDYNDSAWDRGQTGLGFGLPGAARDGLVAYWPLDEGAGNAVHDLAHSYNGSLAGAPKPAWAQGPSGYGTALRFDGQPGSCVDCGRVGVNIASGFTLACWVSAPPAALGRFGVMLAKGPKDAGHYEMYLNGMTGGGRTDGGAAFYAPDLGDFWSGYVVPDGAWHHLAWTYDGGSVDFCANGQLRRTFAAAGQVKPETERLTIGALTDGGFPFLGTLDDIRIYDQALTQTQIGTLAGLPTYDIKTDIRPAMWNVNSTVWIRLAFDCPDPAACDVLVLYVKDVDGFAAYLNGVKVAADNAPESLTWDSRALAPKSQLSGEFDLSAFTPLLRPGRNVLALQGLNDSTTDPDFLVLPTLVAEARMDPSNQCYFASPTPGRPNAAGFASLAEPPQFSRESGTFASGFSLALTSPSPRARIFFTVDGSEPTESSQEYAAPFSLVRSVEVRARAYEPNCVPSAVQSRTFLALAPDLAAFNSNLPIVLIDTSARPIPGTDSDAYAQANAVFIDTGADGRASVAGTAEYAGRVGLRIRGRSSTQFPKQQYKLEVWNDADRDQEVAVLGLPAESDWVLSASYSDKTLMRNYLAYGWWERLGHYSVRTRFCEVFLNDDGAAPLSYGDDYAGVYLLTESVKIGPDRVDLADGGCIVEMGNLDQEDFLSTISGQTVAFAFSDPSASELSATQQQWVQDSVTRFETALYGPRFADPYEGYAAYTDVESQIDYDLMREFTRNFDGGSTFFSIDPGGRLRP
jgi:hypothetical protein